MIKKLTDEFIENNIDVYDKSIVYLAKDFIKFDGFTPLNSLETILKRISNSQQVVFCNLLPENLDTSLPTQLKNGLKQWKVSISYVISGVAEEHQQIVESYNGKQVFVVLEKNRHHKLFGTSKEPLLFIANELDSPKRTALKGYAVTISGIVTEPARFISTESYSLIERSLVQQLVVQI